MGKVKLVIGGLLIIGTGIAAILGLRKEKDERSEKICKMISDVDLKKEEKVEEKTAEELIDECDQALESMDLDDVEVTQVTDEETDAILKRGSEVLRKANSMLGDSEENRQKEQDILQNIEKIQNEVAKGSSKYFEEEWPKKVEEAAKNKNFSKLEQLFDEKYAGGPWHPSPASVFGSALGEGFIDEKLYNAAQKYFDRLWFYSGD